MLNQDSPAAKPWRLLPLLMAMTAIGPATLNILVPALPALTAKLGTDVATVQLTISLYMVSLACAQLLLGPLSDRFGRRPVVLAGLTIAVLASIGAYAATSIGALIAARIIQAAGVSTGIVMGRAIIRDLYDRDRAAGMIGLVTTAMVIAPMLAPVVGGTLETLFGWEAIFLFIMTLTGAVLTWAVLMLPETRILTTPVNFIAMLRDWKYLLSNGKFYAYALCGAFGCAPHFAMVGGGPHVIITLMGRSSAEYGLWFMLSSLGYMAGNFTVSRIAQRFGLDTLIIAGLAVEIGGAIISVILFASFPDGGPGVLFLPQFIISYGNGLLLPNCISGAISVRPEAAGTASGVIGFIQMGAGAASVQIVSVLLVGATTAMPIAWTMLALVAAATVSFLALRR
ncbi:MAG: multidrug effflux MFS transporter [Pseudolabrys sp.]|nr:multidrug effflux MFS transporter [Pseudolabrys sp.]